MIPIAHFRSLRSMGTPAHGAGVVILGYNRAGQFVVIAHEVGCCGTLVRCHHGLDPFVIAVANGNRLPENRMETKAGIECSYLQSGIQSKQPV
jgi:hypothetical protein